MSVCLDASSAALIQPAPAPPAPSSVVALVEPKLEPAPPSKAAIAKLVVSGQHLPSGNNQVLQKVVNSPLITVLNSAGPLTVVKSLCVTSVVSSAPHYTLVNSTPLTVTTNAGGKPPTITVLNCGPLTTPVTVVKAISTQPPSTEKTVVDGNPVVPNVQAAPLTTTVLENRGHNVFVKNTCAEPAIPEAMPQSHKLLTAANFSSASVLNNVPLSNKPTTVNGQRSKVKILSNVQIPGPSQTNVILNKNAAVGPSGSRPLSTARPKLTGNNGASAKYFAKQITNIIKSRVNSVKTLPDKSVKPANVIGQKNVPTKPVTANNFVQKQAQAPVSNLKTLSPQNKNVPGQVQRTGSGLRTIPPQRPQKPAVKPNYIGKHAVQAQKVKQMPYAKMKTTPRPQSTTGPIGSYNPPLHEKQLTFNQALAAQIIETLSSTSSTPTQSSRYEIMPSRYDNAFKCPEKQQSSETTPPQTSEDQQNKSGLDALSLICQAVLLDHNYNATLPSDSPPRPAQNVPPQINGLSAVGTVMPAQARRRPPPQEAPMVPQGHANLGLTARNNALMLGSAGSADDDAASDISDCSDRKHDTEGEETDTAPEVEDVKNDDHYGDYVTRCICGFLHDDGYMVECDRCKVWQHVQCVVKNRQIPEEYLCEICDPSKHVDRQKARLAQQQWIRERQLLEPKIRKEAKLKDALRQKENHTDSESSDNEQPPRNNNVIAKGRTLASRRKAETQRNARREMKEAPVHRRPKRKERKIVKRKAKVPRQPPPPAPSHSDDENQDAWSAHLPQLRQWIEKYEEAVTNHYSPELRARISSIRVNGAYVDSVNPQYDSSVCKCRVHTQPLTEIKYLVSTAQLAPDTPVVELRGKYMLSMQHRHAGGSLATRQHTQRPGPFLFFYKLPPKDNTEVCVDTRTYGNSARFIRRSCRPNAELRHCIEKGVLHLYVVAVTTVEKNSELTIKHESHDLAAVGTTQIACACGRPDQCAVNKTSIKRNGEVSPAANTNANAVETTTRKRRGRRTVSTSFSPAPLLRSSVKESPPQIPQEPAPPTVYSPPPPEIKPDPDTKDTKDIKVDIEEAVDVKMEIKEEILPKIEIKIEPKVEEEDSDESPVTEDVKPSPPSPVKTEIKKEKIVKEEKQKSPASTPIATRRSSHYKSDKEDGPKESESKEQSAKSKKLSREERKLEAILRAIEQMEKADQKKQEHQAKQAHRRESEPGLNPKEEDKQEPKIKRRRRRGRARTTSTNTQVRRSRLNSTDSYVTSGDENLLSPNEGLPPHRPSFKDDDAGDKAADLLLALSNGDSDKQLHKSPVRDGDSNNTSIESSPEAPQLSSACLLVQAAVEPLESGFKFPKTKKGLMNEWLNKAPESLQQSVSYISPPATAEEASIYASNSKNLAALAQAASFCDSAPQTRGGNAKKRWLRQAISEDHSTDGASNRPDSPTISEAVAPPKKRRLPRESLSTDNSPPTTPTSSGPAKMIDTPRSSQEGGVEIVYSSAEGDSPVQAMESDTELKERAAQMKQEFGKATQLSQVSEPSPVTPRTTRTLLDPRLSRENSIFASDHLVGTVEKTLSMLGFESGGIVTPAKRKVKLSITEYRQRKKLNTDKTDEQDEQSETPCVEDTNSSESFKPESISRPRSGSSSSSTSFTSGDEMSTSELVVKAPAFNSEPTELERQREISSLRLKKAFGLSIDDDVRKPPVLDVNAILNCDLEPVQRPSPHTLMNPGFSSTSFCESSMSPTLLKSSDIPDRTCTPPVVDNTDAMDEHNDTNQQQKQEEEEEEVKTHEEMPMEDESTLMEESGVEKMETSDYSKEEEALPEDEREEDSEKSSSNLFYTPDDDEDRADRAPVVEQDEVNYVPPFNNPVYPNNNFTSFTSAIDDDSRYQSRNPSPPPDLGTPPFGDAL